MIPTHPNVTNTPPLPSYLTIGNLKDPFFAVPLHPDFLFAFTWVDPDTGLRAAHTDSSQFSQGLQDSPHVSGQALVRDFIPSTLLYYVDDIYSAALPSLCPNKAVLHSSALLVAWVAPILSVDGHSCIDRLVNLQAA